MKLDESEALAGPGGRVAAGPEGPLPVRAPPHPSRGWPARLRVGPGAGTGPNLF